MKTGFLEAEGGGVGNNWAEITLVKTSDYSGAVTKDREKFDRKLTGAGRVQQATARRISSSVPFSLVKWRMVLLSWDLSQCRTNPVKMRNI